MPGAPSPQRARKGGTPQPAEAIAQSTTTVTRPAGRSGDGFEMSRVLAGEELARSRVFYAAVCVVMIATALFVPALPGPYWLRLAAAGAGGFVSLLSAVVLMVARRRQSYTPTVATVAGVVGILVGTVTLYYVGIFSAGAMIFAVVVYFFGMSHSRGAATSVYVTTALAYLAISACVAGGVLEDRGLFCARASGPATAWFQVVMSQLNFAMVFLLARGSRRSIERAIDRTRRMTVQLRQRDALLDEARNELDRAMRAGDGRYGGQSLAGYVIGPLLGRGGMGEVYRAQSTAGLAVAIKLLHANLVEEPEHVKRFLREAQAACSVQSAHVPRIHEVGWTREGIPYLVMDLLEGHDLGWHLRRSGRLEPGHVVELCEQVASALGAVREAGIVHRDLKPGNLFLTDSIPPTWKVLDFGLSKIVEAQSSATGRLAIGTPMYMAPEQIIGPSVDHLADEYALGAIAYRALTGSPVIDGRDMREMFYNVIYAQPACPSDLVPMSFDVESVLAIGLAKEREQRFACAEDFAAALRAAVVGELDVSIRDYGESLLLASPWGTSRRTSMASIPPEFAALDKSGAA
jgi:eukaryotic-like serine/threonine-protein kinase